MFEISVCNAQSCPVYSSYDYYDNVSVIHVYTDFAPIPTLCRSNSGIVLRKVRIPTLRNKVRIPTLRRTILELYRFLLCSEHIYYRSNVINLLHGANILQIIISLNVSLLKCRTPEREVRGSRPTAAVLCP